VIFRQIGSLKRNDPETAFSFASPSVRQQFVNSDKFMRMIVKDYPILLLHSKFEFRDLQKLDNIGFVQTVIFEKKWSVCNSTVFHGDAAK